MASLSLEASVRTCSVNVGEANRIQSDRFFNPNNMVCIPWNGVNNKGQEVCPDSFWTKTAGCNSSEDRVLVENALRPKYMNYVTLNAGGLDGNIYGNVSAQKNSDAREQFMQSRNNITGNFGTQFGAKVDYQGCSVNAYERNMAQISQAQRQENFLDNGYKSYNSRRIAGGY
jgi:hypothetical protein